MLLFGCLGSINGFMALGMMMGHPLNAQYTSSEIYKVFCKAVKASMCLGFSGRFPISMLIESQRNIKISSFRKLEDLSQAFPDNPKIFSNHPASSGARAQNVCD